MGCCKKICIFTLVALVGFVGYLIYITNQHPPTPKLDQDQWWGRGSPPKSQDASIRPFKVEFDAKRIADLQRALLGSDWYYEPLKDVGFQYGFNGKYLREVVEFWRAKYDFAEREKYLNKFPQFKTNIQGLDIHFIHIKQTPAKDRRVIPILLLHGWPESFVEFFKMIPLLASSSDDRDFVFDIVVPSLPGYGYSQIAFKTDMGFAHVAVIMRNLMARLGYKKYVIHGGDIGSAISKTMSSFYPEEIYGCHTNFPAGLHGTGMLKLLVGTLWPSLAMEEKHISKVYPLTKKIEFVLREWGYAHMQCTKPDTLGIGLMDSPVGLAAYILEKYASWTNSEWMDLPDGGLTKKYTLTELLDNIMIYWDSRCITTSMRLQAQSMKWPHLKLNIEVLPVHIPTAVARFSNEFIFATKWMLAGIYSNIVQISDFETGGHLAAFEEPELMANDIIKAVAAFDKYHKTKKEEL